jgi:hypothetical protein
VYTVTEAAELGWSLTLIGCTPADANRTSVIDVDTGVDNDGPEDGYANGDTTVNIKLAAGENIICTFTNTSDPGSDAGSITIRKDTDPDVNNASFDFDGSFGEFDLNDGQEIVFDDLADGVYEIFEENLPSDWDFDGVDCEGDDESSIAPISSGVRITLASSEDIVCLFDNDREEDEVVEPQEPDEPEDQEEEEEEEQTTPVAQVQAAVATATPTPPVMTPTPAPTPVAEVLAARPVPPSAGSGGLLDQESNSSANRRWMAIAGVSLLLLSAAFWRRFVR